MMKTIVCFAVAALFSLAACTSKPDPVKEEAAIKNVITAETQSWINRDTVAWLNCYAQLPNSIQVWNNRNGSWSANRGWDNIFRENIRSFRNDNTPRTDRHDYSNWMIQLCGDDWAWVTFDQTIRRDSLVYPTNENRMMKKIGGQWKIVSVQAFWDYTKTPPPPPVGSPAKQ